MFQIGNERVALVTDTSCDLSDEQLSQYDIRTVALRVATSQGEFRDRLEITQEQLYDLLQREVPKTSLPLPEDVSNLYRTLHDEGATSILHLSISGSLSGTFNMVSLLAEDFEDMKIHVFDSKTLSCGLGLLVLEAAESLQNGMSVEDTIALLEKRREHQLGAFVIRTLEFLRKGGRIGRVEGAIGSLLQIKPVIYVNDEGVYNTLCKARGFSNALTAMVDEIIRRCNILGCKMIVVVPSKDMKERGLTPTRKEIREDAVAVLKEMVKKCEPHGIRLSLEFCGEPSMTINRFEDAYAIVEEVNSPLVGVTLDQYHFYAMGSGWDTLEKADGKKIFVWHLNGTEDMPCGAYYNNDEKRLWPGAEGDCLPHARYADTLRKIGFDGDCCTIEIFRPAYYEMSQEENVKKSAEVTRAHVAKYAQF